jgi:hypothetical protein
MVMDEEQRESYCTFRMAYAERERRGMVKPGEQIVELWNRLKHDMVSGFLSGFPATKQ